jgi:hypothetical protein
VDLIRGWYNAQNGAVRADLTAVMETLEVISRDRWPESRFKQLQNRRGSQCEGLDELRLEVEKVHYRIFGFSGPRNNDFTMLLPLKKDDDPKYKWSCEEAQRRKAEVINDWTRAREWRAS